MSYSGYPTPDIDPSQSFIDVCINIPTSIGDVFYQVLLGQISEMANEYYWSKSGTMTPEDCAFLWSQTLANTSANLVECGNMTCEQIIDCIENDADTQLALLQYLSDSGIQPTSGSNPPLPTSAPQTASQLLPEGYICDSDHLFGISRWIVQQLDLSTRQVLAAIETLTNNVELAATFADNVEGISWFGSGLELAAWLQDQLIEWYDVAYTPTVEDTLACEIFCLIQQDCELTLDKIIQAYSGNSFGVPTDLNDWLSVLDWLVSTTFDGSIGTVASYHYFIAQALRFGSQLPIFDGLRGLRLIVEMGKNEVDANWNILCSCPPPPTGLTPQIFGICTGGGPGGTNVTYLGGNRWRIDSTHRSVPDEAITFKELNDNTFKLANVSTLPSIDFYGWLTDADFCTSSSTLPNLNVMVFKQFAVTMPNGNSFTFEFDMIAP